MPFPQTTQQYTDANFVDGILGISIVSSGGLTTAQEAQITALENGLVTANAAITALENASPAASTTTKSFTSATRGIKYINAFLLRDDGDFSVDIDHADGPANFTFGWASAAIPHDPEVARYYHAGGVYAQVVTWEDQATDTLQHAICLEGATLTQKQTLPPLADGGWKMLGEVIFSATQVRMTAAQFAALQSIDPAITYFVTA